MKNKRPVPDTIINWFAARDKWSGNLFQRLEDIGRTELFPAAFKNQVDLARSLMVGDKNYREVDSIIFLKKLQTGSEGKRGWVYFFKYRVKKTDDWKIGLSGLQPLDLTAVSSDNKLALLTDKKLKNDRSQDEQLQEQLTRLLYTFRKSAKNFYDSDESTYRMGRLDILED